jgi:uncharacterized protein (TIGR02266 family)
MKIPRAERITINHEFASVDQFITEYVTNISRTGVFIRSKDPLPIGTKVNLRFTVIMDEIETIEGVGEVMRVSHNPTGMGVAFVKLTSFSKNLIERLITKQVTPAAQGPLSPGPEKKKGERKASKRS